MLDQQDSTALAGMVEVWKSRVDAIATQLMIGGDASAAISELLSIGQEASQHNAAEAARVVVKLVSALEGDADAGVALLLKDGLTELQAAFDISESQPVAKAAMLSLGDDAELIADFVVESREHLSQIEGQMLVLERDPTVMEVIHAVFRAFHTIKGLAGFLDFKGVQAVAHEVESLLDFARNEKLVIDSAVVDVVLESEAFLQSELTAIETSLNNAIPLEVADNTVLIAKVRQLATSKQLKEASANSASPVVENQIAELPQLKTDAPVSDIEDTKASLPDVLEGVQFMAAPTLSPRIAVATSTAEPESSTAKPQAVTSLPNRPIDSSGTQLKEPPRSPDASSVRVETAKLDHLMNMVGEIVIAQSLIRNNQALAGSTDSRLLGDLSQLARVTAEVQRATMSIRMVPISQLFQRIERVIRDLSRKAGKQVVLETSGSETEIDKTVAEELSDPLLHMVRNSVDHGIEMAAERIAAGKSAEARIRLSAYHQGGQVVIEISDDGRGLNSTKIRKKAEERQLISADKELSESEVYQLIFQPGFSTAEQITDISGRGVGMDVVRRNVERLRGRIETQSELGKGTTFLLKLPLTLAIIDGLVVAVGTEHYIVPLASVREIFRPQSDMLFSLEGRNEMVLVRKQLMPLVKLHQRLGITPQSLEPTDGVIVVLATENKCFCLLVDELLGKQEVVIKSLGESFEMAAEVSGCAVLGDGRVGLILDPDGVYRGNKR